MKIIAIVITTLLAVLMVTGIRADSDHDSRLSVLEARWGEIDRRLEKLDMKIDRLLQQD